MSDEQKKEVAGYLCDDVEVINYQCNGFLYNGLPDAFKPDIWELIAMKGGSYKGFTGEVNNFWRPSLISCFWWVGDVNTLGRKGEWKTIKIKKGEKREDIVEANPSEGVSGWVTDDDDDETEAKGKKKGSK